MADNKVNLLVTLKDQASKGIGGLTSKLGSFGKLLNPVTLGVAALGAALTKLAFDAAKTGDFFAKTAKQIGTSADVLSELGFAAQIGGAEVTDVATSLRILSKRVNDANRGLVTSVEAFQQAGIETRKANGEFKSAEQLLMDSADAFAQMENATERTALAMELFGRSGGKLVPILIEGSESIKELRDEAKTLGITFTNLEAKQAEDMTDAFLRLTSVFKGIALTIGKALMPFFTALFTILKDALLPVIPLVRGVMLALSMTFKAIVKPLEIIIELFSFLFKVLNGIKNSGRAIRNFFIKLFNEDIPSEEELEARRKSMGALFNSIDSLAAVSDEDRLRALGLSVKDAGDAAEETAQKLNSFQLASTQASKAVVDGFGNAMTAAFMDTTSVVTKSSEEMADTIVTMVDDIGVAMANAVLSGDSFKDSLSSIFKSVGKMIVQQVGIMIARLIALQIVMAATGASAGGLFNIGAGSSGGIIGSLGGAIGGFTKGVRKIFKFADGGRPPVNQPSIVGERGAELFVPDRPGTIIPNEMLGGQSIGVVNILPNANLDEALLAKPMSYWLSLTQEKLLPALNNLGKSGQTTTLNFRRSR